MGRCISVAICVVILAVIYQLIRIYVVGGICTCNVKMDGKTVIITGANAGIGKETALDLAKRGARVIMACRDLKRSEAALNDIVERTGSKKVVLKQLDLASMKSIRKFAEDINKNEPELHVLINNAGVGCLPQLERTEDGFEMIMGVNHLGHFLLTNLLLDLLKKSSPSRIVVVSSMSHKLFTTEMKFDYINSDKLYNKWETYSQSKLANILFARELAKRLQGSGVTANSLHPGFIITDIFRHFHHLHVTFFWKPLAFLLGKTPEQGAQTTIYLAVSDEVEGISGLYFDNCKPQEPSKEAQDDAAAKKLWRTSVDIVELNSTI